MGLFKKIRKRNVRLDAARSKRDVQRRCHFEKMEPRQMLDADPVVAGITYLEDDLGQDSTPDYFEVTFQGGADTTQLTQFVINGDQDLSGGLSTGDMFFDVDGNGAGQSHGFKFHAGGSVGVNAGDVTGVNVSNDGLVLTVNVKNFEAGDKLAFTIDVDEVERLRHDKIASGVEFEGTFFSATFVDENYTFQGKDVAIQTSLSDGQLQTQNEGLFYDEYDNLLSEGENLSKGTLDLVGNNEHSQADRNAAAVDVYELVPKPVEISGTVYHDENINCEHDSGESGIGGVKITLQKFNPDTFQYENVAETQTDGSGNYKFGSELGLTPGKFRLIEGQPGGFLDVGASAGNVDGTVDGDVSADAQGNDNIIGDIDIPLGGTVAENYDFKEVRPATIAGNVYHDRNDDGNMDSGEEGIANVLIQVTRIGAQDASISDPFASTDPIFIRTDDSGHYEVTGLPPGIYEITEINNYPAGSNPLADFVDGKDTVGTIAGATNGTGINDMFNTIDLRAGQDGIEYNFGELKPGSISGYVSLTTPEGDCLDPSDPAHTGIAGVEIQLLDSSGNLVSTTRTDTDGRYEFSQLGTGIYTVVEIQPDGYVDGNESIGSIAGQEVGLIQSNDRISQVDLSSGDKATMYNFCEHLPAQIKGTVWFDVNNDGGQQDGEKGISGVTIQLFDKDGNLVAEQTTDENGDYCFEDLAAGEYRIREIQPTDYVDGKERIGQVNGKPAGEHTANDEYSRIVIRGGESGIDYDFGEIRLASIDGFVHLDPDGDCVFDQNDGDDPLAGVTVQLLNQDGATVAQTVTDANGHYEFDDLLPGEYSVRQIQPNGVFTAGERVGSGGGEANENVLSKIVINSGQNLVNYNFCEEEAAGIQGRVWEDGPAFETENAVLPTNYRNLRDGMFTPGVDTPISGVRMELWYYIDPVTNEIAPRPVKLSEVLGEHYTHVGNDPNAPVWVETSANGEYHFAGLHAGNYIVLEHQPDGFADANDTPGSTTGFTYNSMGEAAVAPSMVLSTFSGEQIMDSVVNIRINSGELSIQNDFSEVRAVPDTPDVPVIPQTPETPPNPVPPSPPLNPGLGLAGHLSINYSTYIGGGRGVIVDALPADAYSWHLSIVNAGQPRGGDSDAYEPTWSQASYLSEQDWNRFDMESGIWTFTTRDSDGTFEIEKDEFYFGMIGGTPLSGDFDGDGDDEVVLFHAGYWMIDLNGNGRWDIDDLMARLGNEEDRPVVGDWDGDGKDDIGIYGPVWEGDQEAIASDPGIPDPDNAALTRPKNLPPQIVEAADGARAMRLSSFGSSRIDVIDHVFGYGEAGDTPVTGDWNGDSIRTIGIFHGGTWHLDMNGDGRFDYQDAEFTFGKAGDIPLVGDFNGDGVEEVAVYRNGTWIIDTNGNHQQDVTDQVFELGGRGDVPVTGDWNGDGIDEPALYQAGGSQAHNNPTIQ